jgi:molybdopterin-containing oxidoreductase family iron-sulfur binding subunit
MTESEKAPTTRRGVLAGLAGTLGAALALTAAGRRSAAAEPPAAEPPAAPEVRPLVAAAPLTSDALGRMHVELARALAKPRLERRWVMVIDLRKCVGCHACTIACVAENKLPPGVVYRPVLDEEIGTYPNVTRRFIPRPCMQCNEPPCTPVCPVNATWKNDDGIVVVNYDQCIGCRYCLTACPYGARTSDFGYTYTAGTPLAQPGILGQEAADDYERVASFEYGKARERKGEESPIGNARKCHFCTHRIAEGMLPSCVTTCIGRATLFGDANDPDSLVAEMIAKPNVMRLKEEMGTEPRVYYLL